jgi:protein O-mannosyl-transferase
MKVSRNKQLLILIVSILTVTGVIYSNFWDNGFHLDDYHTIESNLFIRSLSNVSAFFSDAKTFSVIPANASWRPIVTLSSAIDYWLAGGELNPFYFHLSMFIFFIMQIILMFFIYEKLLKKSFETTISTNLAAIGVFWYAVHPVCAETINYIIARSDSLATFFMLLAFWFYLKEGVYKKYFLYLIPLCIGAMAKPTALMFFPIVLIYEVLYNENKNIFNPKPYFSKNVMWVALPTGIFFFVMYGIIKIMEAETFNPGGESLFHYLITQPFIYAHYLEQFFIPLKLSAQSDYVAFESIANPKALLGFIFLTVFIFTIYKTQFNIETKPIAFGLSFFLLALIPTTVIPLAEVTNDHRMFYPFVGLILAFITGFYLLYERYLRKRIPYKMLLGSVILCLSLYGYGTYQRNKTWLTEETLWKDATEKSPNNGMGWLNYGLEFLNKKDFTQAEGLFLHALNFIPQYAPLHTNLGITYQQLKQMDKAEQYFNSSLSCKYSRPSTHYFYARYKYQAGDNDEAIKHAYTCLQEAPGELRAREMLFELLYDTERFEELSKLGEETLKILPNNEFALSYLKKIEGKKSKLESLEIAAKDTNDTGILLNLSLAYYNASNFIKCIEVCQRILALDPKNSTAYNNICSSYNALKVFDKAIQACNNALEIQPDFQLAKNNLEEAKNNRK